MKYDVAASRHSQHPGEGPVGAGPSAPVAAKAAAIKAAQAQPLTWKTVVKRALVVAVAGAAIYLVCCPASSRCWVPGRACRR